MAPEAGAAPPAQDDPRPPWRNTVVAGWLRNAQRGVDARRFVRRHNRSLAADAPILNFFPMQPTEKVHIRKILMVLGLRIGSEPGPPGATIAWDTGTGFSRRAARRLPPDAINRACLDISKSTVDRQWAEASGYTISVDPLTWDGLMVVKSEGNGRHDGRIVRGPLDARRAGRVYQRYVNAIDDGKILEMRTAIVGNQVPAAILKWRPPNNWSNRTVRAVVQLGTETYSPAEIKHLLAFAQRMHLDYGELDVLRDRDSGLIYVLDANRTPYGPPHILPTAEADRHAAIMSEAFAALLEQRS